MSKGGEKKYLVQIAMLERIKQALEGGKQARVLDYTEDEEKYLKELSC